MSGRPIAGAACGPSTAVGSVVGGGISGVLVGRGLRVGFGPPESFGWSDGLPWSVGSGVTHGMTIEVSGVGWLLSGGHGWLIGWQTSVGLNAPPQVAPNGWKPRL